MHIFFPHVAPAALTRLSVFFESKENRIDSELRAGGGIPLRVCSMTSVSMSEEADDSKKILLQLTVTILDGYYSREFNRQTGFYKYVPLRDKFFKKISRIIGDTHPEKD